MGKIENRNDWQTRQAEEWEAILAETDVAISQDDLKYIQGKIEELKEKNKTGKFRWQSRGSLHIIFHKLGITEIGPTQN
jgi:hypothetical protein